MVIIYYYIISVLLNLHSNGNVSKVFTLRATRLAHGGSDIYVGDVAGCLGGDFLSREVPLTDVP